MTNINGKSFSFACGLNQCEMRLMAPAEDGLYRHGEPITDLRNTKEIVTDWGTYKIKRVPRPLQLKKQITLLDKFAAAHAGKKIMKAIHEAKQPANARGLLLFRCLVIQLSDHSCPSNKLAHRSPLLPFTGATVLPLVSEEFSTIRSLSSVD